MLLKRLSEAMGPPGIEDEVRNVIRDELAGLPITLRTDVMGNLMATTDRSSGVLLAAHMDEVSVMIVRIEDDGLLKFRPMGGLDPRVTVAKPLRVGPNKVWGVIGAKAIHLQSPDDRKRQVAFDDLYIDIGATSREDALRSVSIGDCAVFATEFAAFGEGCVKGKSLDDRAGCAVLIDVLKRTHAPAMYAWTVQEEIGLRGAGPLAYSSGASLAIVVEATVCFDVGGTPSHQEGTKLGHGPVISLVDSHTITPPQLVQQAVDVAKQHNIPFQYKRTVAGGNDAGRIHLARGGIPTLSISIPARYIHAPVQVISLDDYENTVRFIAAILEAVEEGRIGQ